MVNTISIQQIFRFLKERRLPITLSLILGTTIYIFVVKSVGKSYNILYHWKPQTKLQGLSNDYDIYTGGSSGVYHSIGRLLEADNLNGSINIKNSATHGGYENALNVLAASGGAFGIVQEEAFGQKETVRHQLRYVTPLYQERMHIIYNKKMLSLKEPTISNHSDPDLLRFFSERQVSIGPVGSGTQILASYLINELNDQITAHNGKDSVNTIDILQKGLQKTGMNDAFVDLRHGSIGAMFNLSGAPTGEITSMIVKDSSKFGLISIDPSFITKLKVDYSINLMTAEFKDKYVGYNDETTLSTFAYLVSKKSTPPADIKQLLFRLHKNKNQHLSALGISKEHQVLGVELDENSGDTLSVSMVESPLEEFDSYNNFINQEGNDVEKILKNILLLIATIVSSSIVFFYLLSMLVSNSRTDFHHDYLVDIISNNIPQNAIPSVYQYIKLKEFDLQEMRSDEYINYRKMVIVQLTSQHTEVIKGNFDIERLERFMKDLRSLSYAELVRIAIILTIECQEEIKTLTKDPRAWKPFKKINAATNLVAGELTAPSLVSGRDVYSIEEKIVTDVTKGVSGIRAELDRRRIKRALLDFLRNEELIGLIQKKEWFDLLKKNEVTLVPFIKEDQLTIINRIVQGLSDLFNVRIKISEDYSGGLIVEKHYNFLLKKTDDISKKLRRGLFLRLEEFIRKGDHDADRINELLRSYYVAGYIGRKAYNRLGERVKL